AVDVKGEVREGRADGLDHAQIPAGPELQLDPREARIDGALDLFHQHVEGVLDPEVGSDCDAIPRAAEGAVQGQPASLGIQYPPRDLESGPGELVALDEGKAIKEVLGGGDLLSDDARGHQRAEGVEGARRVLRG